MSLLDSLSQEKTWLKFYNYKTSLVCKKKFTEDLRKFIEAGEYLPVYESIKRGEEFPLPEKAIISKADSQKKRTVYKYPQKETTVLKLLTYLLLRKYDGIFADNLFSFRPGRTAKDAIKSLLKTPGIRNMYAYKADVSNYFNSMDISLLLPLLEEVCGEDRELYAFLSSLLEETRVLDKGRITEEEKGIMAGTPLSAFYANLFLSDLDRKFEGMGVPYARYSDDIIVFAQTKEGAEEYGRVIREHLEKKRLTVNPDKEEYFTPETGFVFLGFCCKGNTVDIAPFSVKKIKHKMRRKMRSLQRWQKRRELTGEKAAAAFIRIFNAKLLDSPRDNDLSWSGWFFSVINTSESLKVIDGYAQQCIRTLATGRNTKGRYNFRYEDMKKLGYRSLVHEYYSRDAEE